MELIWYCAMCGKQGHTEIDTSCHVPEIFAVIQSQPGWIIQHNGKNTDIYCCKKCAQ